MDMNCLVQGSECVFCFLFSPGAVSRENDELALNCLVQGSEALLWPNFAKERFLHWH